MPPHCDTLDGPVVTTAREALEKGNVNLILPYAPKEAEPEIKKAFERTIAVGKAGVEAKELADYWFFETVVRLHRVGEGAPYTGLKPAGLSEGPVLPLAEEALDTGSAEKLVGFISKAMEEKIRGKLHHALHAKEHAHNGVDAAREHVSAVLGFELWSHHLYEYITAGGGHGH